LPFILFYSLIIELILLINYQYVITNDQYSCNLRQA
jgi:hypothetical protein